MEGVGALYPRRGPVQRDDEEEEEDREDEDEDEDEGKSRG